jgi:hypothetical protein
LFLNKILIFRLEIHFYGKTFSTWIRDVALVIIGFVPWNAFIDWTNKAVQHTGGAKGINIYSK